MQKLVNFAKSGYPRSRRLSGILRRPAGSAEQRAARRPRAPSPAPRMPRGGRRLSAVFYVARRRPRRSRRRYSKYIIIYNYLSSSSFFSLQILRKENKDFLANVPSLVSKSSGQCAKSCDLRPSHRVSIDIVVEKLFELSFHDCATAPRYWNLYRIDSSFCREYIYPHYPS